MTFSTRALSAFVLALACTSTAVAQDGLPGTYELEGRYSNRRTTKVEVEIKERYGDFSVKRTGRYVSQRYKHLPAFTWTSSEAVVHGSLLVVTFKRGENAAGMAARLRTTSSDADILATLSDTNVFRAVYMLGSNKSSLREVVYNTTRLGGESNWRWIKTRGQRATPAAPANLSYAAFSKKTKEAIEGWYTNYINEGYDEQIANASTAAERVKLEEGRKNDLDLDMIEIMDGHWWFDESIDEDYDNGDVFRDAAGKKIERKDVIVFTLSFYPDLAGIGLSKGFVFHRQTGELLDEGDIQD